MKISVTSSRVPGVGTDVLVLGLFQNEKRLSGAAADVDAAMDGALARFLADEHVEGKAGQSSSFPTFGMLKARKVALIGLGDRKRFDADAARRFGAQALKAAASARAAVIAARAGTLMAWRRVWVAWLKLPLRSE